MNKLKVRLNKLIHIPLVNKAGRTFLRTFAVTFALGVSGVLSSGHYTSAKDALLALMVASVVAAAHSVEILTKEWLAEVKEG